MLTDRCLASLSMSGVEHLLDFICSTALQLLFWSTFQLDMKVLACSAGISLITEEGIHRKREEGVSKIYRFVDGYFHFWLLISYDIHVMLLIRYLCDELWLFKSTSSTF